LCAFAFTACSSGGGAGPGGGGAGGGAGRGGSGGGNGGTGGASGSGGTSGVAGTSGGGGRGGSGGGTAGSGGAAGAGGAAGSGGAGGSGGAAGSAGAAGTAGSAGAAGAGSSAGTGGSAGASAGSGGRGGAGGSAGAGASAGAVGSGGVGGATTNLRVEYMSSSTTATAFTVRITNLGPSMPLISGLRIRYYFHDNTTNGDGGPGMDATPTVTAATWQIASPSTSINLRSTGGCSASAAFTTPATIDLGCYLASPMNAQDTITISISVDPTTQLAVDDYSYVDTGGAFVANDHITLFWNGVLQSGTPPP
jgi:hypothetical protein